jgi:lipopolysaccharide/colanic/teichoic acid biosynthesis glycosyltransferase
MRDRCVSVTVSTSLPVREMSLFRSSAEDNLSLGRALSSASRSIQLERLLRPGYGRAPRALVSFSKRGVDIVGATLGMIAFSPVLALISLAIKCTSEGPVLFRQNRYGLNGRLFSIYKFRTMYLQQCDVSGTRQTVEDDERVTWLGCILRRFNLDELPQLINVIKGEMSLVGPRPHVPGMRAAGLLYEELVPGYFDRLRVKPGITGLAQASGFRGSTDEWYLAQRRIDADLYYIDNWSLALDFAIVGRTTWYELRHLGRGI